MRKELSFDGFGINGPDEFRSRIVTFAPTCKGEERDRYGKLFELAPQMAAWINCVATDSQLDWPSIHFGGKTLRQVLKEFPQ